jgi:hypothetical protein
MSEAESSNTDEIDEIADALKDLFTAKPIPFASSISEFMPEWRSKLLPWFKTSS